MFAHVSKLDDRPARDMVIYMVTKGTRRRPLPISISAAEFKAKCLDLMDAVAETGASITVTKRGRPVAVLAPVAPKRRALRGSMRGRIRIRDKADELLSTDVVWDAER